MKNEFTIVQLSEKLPLSFSVCRFTHVFPDAYPDIRLFIIRDGSCDIHVDAETRYAKKNDRLIINPFTVNSFSAKKPCTRLVAKINQFGFELDEEEALGLKFNLNSIKNPYNKRYESIRYLRYSIIKFNTMDNINSLYTNRAIIFSLFAQLRNDFRVENQGEEITRNSRKLNSKLLSYLHSHYKENISLQFLSEHFNYNLAYLSRLFKKCQGKTFNEYYDELKINNSRNSLLFTNKTIEEVATENGFENARSYVRAFKKKYDKYPSEYRHDFRKKELKNVPQDISLLRKETLNQIFKYYDEYNQTHGKAKESARDLEFVLDVNAKDHGISKPSPLSQFLPIGNIYNVLREDRKSALNDRAERVHFSYGILTDLFASPYRSKEARFHLDNQAMFTIAQGITFLLNLHRKPLLRFTLGPQENHECFLKETASLLNILESYFGREERKSWIFSLESTTDVLHLLPSEFYRFNRTSNSFYRLVKTHGFKIMAPSFPRMQYSDNDIKTIHKLLSKEDGHYDYYSLDYACFKDKDEIHQDKDILKDFLSYLKDKNLLLPRLVIENVRFSSGNNLLYDTLYASSYITRNYLNNYQNLYAITFFTLCDSSLPLLSLTNPYQGVYGYYSYNGRKKASLTAITMLSKADGEVLGSGKNYIISKNDKGIIIIINNYSHYSPLFSQGDYYQINEKERYSCFSKSTNYHCKLHIKEIIGKTVRVKVTPLSASSGSSYDAWLTSGADDYLTRDEYHALNQLSQTSFQISEREVVNGELNLKLTLAPLETQLIEIEY